jgi:hypothetical protein
VDTAKNRFGFSSRISLNMTADFENVGGFPAQTDIGPEAGESEHFYDDGFNRVDDTGNANDSTSFWGYENSTQVPGNDTIRMNSSRAPDQGAVRDVDDNPQVGFEVSYIRELIWDGKYGLGWELTAGWMDVDIKSDAMIRSDVIRTTDVYGLHRITPPPPPYEGPRDGSGPRISDMPNRSVTTLSDAATTSAQHHLESTMISWRTGPYLEIPFNRRFSVILSGGLGLAYIDSDFSYEETTTIDQVGTVRRSGSGSGSNWLAGYYGEGKVLVNLTHWLNIFASGQYQNLGRFSQSVGDKRVKLDMKDNFFISSGLGITF